ncbi:MAG: hypothetical protein PHV20_03570 [Bacteroidales bacterium]|nr:hypothetical protein [Bacteroidales bacterium]
MQKSLQILLIFFSLIVSIHAFNHVPIFKSKAFSVHPDSVIQREFKAKALSPKSISSNYLSLDANKYSSTVQVKFSINSRDNEMPSGKNHIITLHPLNGSCTTTIVFGKQLISADKKAKNIDLSRNTTWNIKLDMRHVITALNKDGFYTLFNGEKLSKADFKGVYIAGGASPLSWDFSNLNAKPDMELKDADGDGIYEITLKLNTREKQLPTTNFWNLSTNLSAQPSYRSDYTISDAVYNLSLEEMIKAIEPDSTFRTGQDWAGVWTRDISYSIILSMAHMQPKVTKYSLMRKVKNDRIIQDTGTGGSYPVSTDRIVWATAAWELYKATGDYDWLKYAYIVIKNSIEDDILNAYDPTTGLVRGESSFLDWREQTYPKWMQPIDIYQSENLGTNAIHYNANMVLSQMATLMNDEATAEKHLAIANKIKEGINTYLWIPGKGYYGQYRYGRNHLILSDKSETLGEAVCVLFGIAEGERAKSVIANTPVLNWGAPCLYPQIPDIPPYHNNAIWPFVQSYFALASAKVGNESAALHQISAIYRTTTMFLTNKENMVAETGDFAGTQINSSRMLWSLSGNIALVHKLLFGINFNANSLTFHPLIPKTLSGKRTLSNFHYRNSILNITMEGFGNSIKKFEIDGVETKPEIAGNLSGKHDIRITLNNTNDSDAKTNLVGNKFSPEAPLATLSKGIIHWKKVDNAIKYRVIKNGETEAITTKCAIAATNPTAEYQVQAIDHNGIASFASEPIVLDNTGNATTYQIEEFAPKSERLSTGYTGGGFVEIGKKTNTGIEIPIEIAATGQYTIQVRYANGNGHIHSDNKCAIRTLRVNNQFTGTLVMPQRGDGEWSNWGLSNAIGVKLNKGKNTISIIFESANENMNSETNQALLDEIVILKR